MPCLLCASDNQAELTAETVIHFSGLKNLDKPGRLGIPEAFGLLGLRLLLLHRCGKRIGFYRAHSGN